MSAQKPFALQERSTLQSDSTKYLILSFSGEGFFGQVAKCLDLKTKEVVAIKILKVSDEDVNRREVEMLKALSSLDPDKTNIVRFKESFCYMTLYCVVFEMLDKNVWDMMAENKRNDPLSLNELRPMVYQLMVAFDALKSQGIMHTDLKPDNIMLVDHKRQPYRLKVIDFGLALPESCTRQGMYMQTPAYRAPEVYLGMPLSAAADMWAVGCVIADMYFGCNLFPAECSYGWMEVMLHLLEQPHDWPLETGIYSRDYFRWDHQRKGWKLLTPEEYYQVTREVPLDASEFIKWCVNLDDAVMSLQTNDDACEMTDREAFLDLLKGCLCINPADRITPSEALRHSFLAMDHLAEDVETSDYAQVAFDIMNMATPDRDHSIDGIDNRSDEEMSGAAPSNTAAAGLPDSPAAGSHSEVRDSVSDIVLDVLDDDLNSASSSGEEPRRTLLGSFIKKVSKFFSRVKQRVFCYFS